MISIQSEVHGLSDLQNQLANLGDELAGKVLASAARKSFKQVLETAKAYVPVDTGLLRDSIRIKVVKPKNGAAAVAVGLLIAGTKGGRSQDLKGFRGVARKAGQRKSAHWRWHYVELGTSFQSPRPFLRPALEARAEAVIEMLRTELAKKIYRAVTGTKRKRPSE